MDSLLSSLSCLILMNISLVSFKAHCSYDCGWGKCVWNGGKTTLHAGPCKSIPLEPATRWPKGSACPCPSVTRAYAGLAREFEDTFGEVGACMPAIQRRLR
ncbi:hypothetical protein GGR56DRAFT_616385 [Xylariaceae sp. FL0804]|nr:hypothetical protein GGR56DRAFT_616385 [Xylariaceae sp. FL0804]